MAKRPRLRIIQQDSPGELQTAARDFLHAKSSLAAGTQKFYQNTLGQFLHFTNEWPLAPETIDAFIASLQARGLKETTVDDYYRCLRIWLAWLHKRKRLESNPMDMVQRPPRPRPVPRAPLLVEMIRFFGYLETISAKGRGHWQDVRTLTICSMLLDTGLRVGELAALRVQDIVIEKKRRTIFIRGRKTHRDRYVVFHKDVGKDLKRWLKVRAGLGLPAGLDALFVSEHRGQWRTFTAWGMRQSLKEYSRRAGVLPIRPHDLRHAYAVYSLRNKADLLDIQKQLGHTSIVTTSRYLLAFDDGRGERHDDHSPRANL